MQATNPNNCKNKNRGGALGLSGPNEIKNTTVKNVKNKSGITQAPAATVPYETRFLREIRYRQSKAVTGTVASIGKTKVSK
jgi:hypothetical protein